MFAISYREVEVMHRLPLGRDSGIDGGLCRTITDLRARSSRNAFETWRDHPDDRRGVMKASHAHLW
jgi:hypothetical protein